MTTCTIRGIPVSFPFEPYPLQKAYMEKVIDCLQNETNGVLESPTGTGKTLSLLCSSLAWLSMKKAQLKLNMQNPEMEEASEFMKSLNNELGKKLGNNSNNSQGLFHLPTIIYASRTHSQLTQAMQELKRTAYNDMRATIIGSREQMCIHPDIMKEQLSVAKIHMCKLKLLSHSCHFYNRVERKKDSPAIRSANIVDIEDLVTLGMTHKFCPYFMARELKHESDIIFMPYNYLLDPKAKRALGIQLSNNIIILDEAHNVEKVCEDSASMQLTSTDITLCIEEVTEVMKAMSNNVSSFMDDAGPKDFSEKELCDMKEIVLNLEKAIDEIEIKKNVEMTTFDGSYIFEILGKAGINEENYVLIINTIEKIVQFLSAVKEGPFQRRGNGLQLLQDLLQVAFVSVSAEFREKIKRCYKVHVSEEEAKKTTDGWLSKASKKAGRVISYWCFSPGFGMSMLLRQGIKCLILTSGTLAPLQPLISELELTAGVQLENPHIVTNHQVCVKIIPKGPDNEPLSCTYRNRQNTKYLSSLGRTILNFMRMIPGGLLIFFPSYPTLRMCQDHWQQEGTWTSMNSLKTIFIEPRDKTSFNNVMNEYYAAIDKPNSAGAIFMGVCRGKVSEGLDFADMNGRAVMIIGLPYPPLKDPKVILKQRYLDICHAKDKQFLRGEDWYSLEATRAVNQAIGRVIRHKDDYGAIILLDNRFSSAVVKSQMSKWLRNRIEIVSNFGAGMRDLKLFFNNAEKTLPLPINKARRVLDNTTNQSVPAEFDVSSIYKQKGVFNFSSHSSTSADGPSNLVNIHKRNPTDIEQGITKKKKIVIQKNIVPNNENLDLSQTTSTKEFIAMVQKALEPRDFQEFLLCIKTYHDTHDFDSLKETLNKIFSDKPQLVYIIQGLSHTLNRRIRLCLPGRCPRSIDRDSAACIVSCCFPGIKHISNLITPIGSSISKHIETHSENRMA
ncbi:DEAD 2 [Popillia japonica]|uniref:Regulator of telomere elongation helicase 1 homolog n=1 Tax=Popillia japonica TaxID=7064 RepID=A0AAW1KSV1_POPJA